MVQERPNFDNEVDRFDVKESSRLVRRAKEPASEQINDRHKKKPYRKASLGQFYMQKSFTEIGLRGDARAI